MGPIVRWEPTQALSRMREDMNRLMEDFFGEAVREPGAVEGIFTPTIDVLDRPNEVVVRAELPGVDKDNIKIEATPESLTLRAEVRKEKEEKGENFMRRERRFGAFQRLIPLPVHIKPNEVKASYHDGVLEVTLPKTEEARSQQPVQVNIE